MQSFDGKILTLDPSMVTESTSGAMLLVRDFLYKANFDGVIKLADNIGSQDGKRDDTMIASIYIECMAWAKRWRLSPLVEIAKYGSSKVSEARS